MVLCRVMVIVNSVVAGTRRMTVTRRRMMMRRRAMVRSRPMRVRASRLRKSKDLLTPSA